MRCRNCGWDNPDNNAKCVKCNQPLYEERGSFTSPGLTVDTDFNFRKTMSENPVFPNRDGGGSPTGRPDPKQTQRLCYNCKRPVTSDSYFCPECGATLSDDKNVPEAVSDVAAPRTTMRDVATPGVTVPGGATSKVTMPGGVIPKVTVPGGSASSKVTMRDVATPGVTVPGGATSKVTVSGDAIPKNTMPGGAIPKVTVPSGVTPRATMRDVATPDVAVPGDATPKTTMPRVETPDVSVPDAITPEETTSEDDISRRTVRPGKRSYCSLTLIPDEKEPVSASPLSFSGKEVVLNRANTEPDNITITSKAQAVLTCEDKHWFIQDRSELKTTYLYVSEKTELKPGDIIVLGDRRFLFDY
jgi:hypothetical protein